MLQKVKDALKSILQRVRDFYSREDVQIQLAEAKSLAKQVFNWIIKTVKANPEAAICGGIIVAVGFIAYSVITFGFILTVVATVVVAISAHYYFVGQNEDANAN
jgi:hypothetical protein